MLGHQYTTSALSFPYTVDAVWIKLAVVNMKLPVLR